MYKLFVILMDYKKMKKLFCFSKTVLLLLFIFSGCTSIYHRGYYFLADKGYVYSNVASRVDKETEEFEKQCLDAFLRYDIKLIHKQLTNKSMEYLTEERVKAINAKVKELYHFNGDVRRISLKDKELPGLRDPIDNFKIYDFIEAEYFLEGTPGAYLKLYLTKVNTNFKLCGFAIAPDSTTLCVEQKKYYGGRRVDLTSSLIPFSIILQILGMGNSFFYQEDKGYLNKINEISDDGKIICFFPETIDKYKIFDKRFGTFYDW